MPNKLRAGFTLVELLIVVAIVAILAAIAYPAYTRHVMKTHRRAATACLMELAQAMERRYTLNMSYADSALPTASCVTELASRYSFAFASGEPTATTYSITATAQGAQANDRESGTTCSPLSIDQGNNRFPAACW